MHAKTIDLLVTKAKLEPRTAQAIAEAIDMATDNNQFVTVPILDARFAAFEAKTEAKFAKLKTDLIVWIIAITVGNNYLPQTVSTITKAIAAAVQ